MWTMGLNCFFVAYCCSLLSRVESMSKMKGIRGTIVHSKSFSVIEIIEDGVVVYDTFGVIEKIIDLNCYEDNLSKIELCDHRGKLIIPGFIDAHVHAPQYSFIGTGMDLTLLKWLESYTFPSEAKFKELNFANQIYRKSIRRHLKCGTTFASYFGTIDLGSNKLLANIIREYGQRAYIGKVSMDRNAPEYYIESTSKSVEDNEDFIKYVLSLSTEGLNYLNSLSDSNANMDHISKSQLLNKIDTPLLIPVITPRFVPTCTKRLMTQLSELSSKYQIPIQSHLCETTNEISWCQELHPEENSYADIYNSCGLLIPGRSYMAHCCFCTKHERELLKSTGTGVVHCPCSNFMIMSGICDVKELRDEGVEVGLGTDVAGGYSPSMLDCIRQTITASRALLFHKRQASSLDHDSLTNTIDTLNTDQQLNVMNADLPPPPPPPPLSGSEPEVKSSALKSAGADLKQTSAYVQSKGYEPINYKEAFYLATQGGANVLGMGNVLGNFEKSKKLDCLVIDLNVENSPVDLFGHETAIEKFEKFLFLGDDRNIVEIYVNGNKLNL